MTGNKPLRFPQLPVSHVALVLQLQCFSKTCTPLVVTDFWFCLVGRGSAHFVLLSGVEVMSY
jgi:hypothetical protein